MRESDFKGIMSIHYEGKTALREEWVDIQSKRCGFKEGMHIYYEGKTLMREVMLWKGCNEREKLQLEEYIMKERVCNMREREMLCCWWLYIMNERENVGVGKGDIHYERKTRDNNRN